MWGKVEPVVQSEGQGQKEWVQTQISCLAVMTLQGMAAFMLIAGPCRDTVQGFHLAERVGKGEAVVLTTAKSDLASASFYPSFILCFPQDPGKRLVGGEGAQHHLSGLVVLPCQDLLAP